MGLRVSELPGLRWEDIDFESLAVNIRRSVVEGEINPTRTEASESVLPLDPDLAEVLLAHKARSSCSDGAAFVFAGRSGEPPWPDNVLADYLKPAATKAGIGNIGWHTFRHTYSTLLHSLGARPIVQKELLRHADVTTTLNLCTQAISAEKRETASKVVDVL